MSKAAELAYNTLMVSDNQESLLSHMQTREQLYDYLNYHEYENKLDELFKSKEKK